MEATYFETPAEWRAWLEKHHGTDKEILVGFYKKDSGKPSITWPQSVDEALCFGWIDGIRRSIDAQRYSIRFTPRKKDSIWSSVNIKRVNELEDLGLMRPAGTAAFERRKEAKSGIYSHEQKEVNLEDDFDRKLRANEKAWSFFQSQAPSYRKAAIWWVSNAKQEATRLKRLQSLINDSEAGRKLPHLIPPVGKK